VRYRTFVQDHPVVIAALVLLGLTGVALLGGIPVGRVSEVAIYVLYGAGVNLLMGYTGLVPFGASVFFGIGSYIAAILSIRLLGIELTGIVAATVGTMIVGVVVGAIILKRRGLYFSLLTLACSQLAFEVAFKWTELTGGENGLQGVQRPWFASPLSFHAVVVVSVVAGLYILWRIAHSPFGRTLQAIRDNEQRVTALGYDVYRIKLVAFVISGGLIGYSGGLLAYFLQGVYANNLSWQHAADAVLMTVLGGVHHFLGPLWGAATFILLSDQLSAVVEHWWLIFAPVLIAFILISPEGVHGLVQRLRKREHHTLTRSGIPGRPEVITPWQPATDTADSGDKALLRVRGLSKRFGSVVTSNDIDLDIHPRKLHSFIGPNGAGKTTFFNILSGLLNSDAGTIEFKGKDITKLPPHRRARLGIGRSFQIISLFKYLTAFENVRIAVQADTRWANRCWTDAYTFEDINAKTWSILAAVGLVERAETTCLNLSHGEQRLLDIAVALAAESDLLLLDEPLAGLADADRETVGAIIQSISKSRAVLLIEHDIDRVLSLSDRITVLHQGKLIADGRPADVASNPEVRAAYMGTSDIRRESSRAQHHLAPARPFTPLLTARGVTAGYDGSKILTNIDFEVGEGEVVALLGRNGVGKTTLLRAITGTIPLISGSIAFAKTPIGGRPSFEINRLGIGLVPEGRRLFPNLTVQENLELAARPGGMTVEEAFKLFPKLGPLKNSKAEFLSGGERQMVAIARPLMAPAKLILLDEPFEGLAPSVVDEVMAAILRLKQHAAIVIVEHKAELVLPICDKAVVLVNGRVQWAGVASVLAQDDDLQERLLGVHAEEQA
jgi:branched-chain amino acid transport system ATP-binding protein